jgi:hypothetical protein
MRICLRVQPHGKGFSGSFDVSDVVDMEKERTESVRRWDFGDSGGGFGCLRPFKQGTTLIVMVVTSRLLWELLQFTRRISSWHGGSRRR